MLINGIEYKARRDPSKGEVVVPYNKEPDIGIGDVISQKSGKREILLKVIDLQFLEGQTLKVGTRDPHLLKLSVENITSQARANKPSEANTFNIVGDISGDQVQIGNNNTQAVNISIQQLSEAIAESNDPEAKKLLKKLLANSTVGSIIGAGASALLKSL